MTSHNFVVVLLLFSFISSRAVAVTRDGVVSGFSFDRDNQDDCISEPNLLTDSGILRAMRWEGATPGCKGSGVRKHFDSPDHHDDVFRHSSPKA